MAPVWCSLLCDQLLSLILLVPIGHNSLLASPTIIFTGRSVTRPGRRELRMRCCMDNPPSLGEVASTPELEVHGAVQSGNWFEISIVTRPTEYLYSPLKVPSTPLVAISPRSSIPPRFPSPLSPAQPQPQSVALFPGSYLGVVLSPCLYPYPTEQNPITRALRLGSWDTLTSNLQSQR